MYAFVKYYFQNAFFQILDLNFVCLAHLSFFLNFSFNFSNVNLNL